MGATVFFGLFFYVFFAHTYIGESNTSIRRMRTAFRPTEDASYIVRKENQKRLAEYLKQTFRRRTWFGRGRSQKIWFPSHNTHSP